MKIGLYAKGSARAILEHTKDVSLGISADTEGVMVEDVLHDVPDGIPAINTCIGMKVFMTSDEHGKAFREEYGLVDQAPASYLYGFLSRDSCSDLMEMSVSGRFLTGNVGQEVGFVQGTGIPCHSSVYDAFPGLAALVDAMHVFEYCGEFTIGVTKDFQICSLVPGHCTGAWSLFTELAQQSPQATLEFCFGKRTECTLHPERIASTTLLSYPPYPYSNTVPFSVIAPRTAERHLYRFTDGSCELAYASASGSRTYEVRRRIRRTTDNCTQYNADLQHRIDYGKFDTFVFNEGRYQELGG